MSSRASSSIPDIIPHRLFIAAVAQGNETRLREIYHENPLATKQTTLQQALQKAVAKEFLPIVRLLVKWGADVNKGEVSLLFQAVEDRRPLVAKELLENGANPDWRHPQNGRSALFMGCRHGLNSIVKALLEAGADPDVRNHEGQTPLLFTTKKASGNNEWNAETLKMLVDKGADINARDKIGRTALLWAASVGNMLAVTVLLSGELGKKADVSVETHRGITALYLATEKNHEEVVGYLLAKGADAGKVTDGGWSALHAASRNGHVAMVHRLLEAGADVNCQLPDGMTPLHWAAMNGHAEVANLLLARPEINLGIKDIFHRTPLLCAVEKGDLDMVRLLSSNMANLRLSPGAEGACRGFRAMVTDFGSFYGGKKHLLSKHSIYDLLYGWDNTTNTPTMTIMPKTANPQPSFRWIHLPANNIEWVERLLEKWFQEGGYGQTETFKAMDECFDQEQHGPLAHLNSMRTFCRRIVPRGPNPANVDKDVPPGIIALFMPFLHYETPEQYRKMNDVINNVQMGKNLGANPSPDQLLINGYLNREWPIHVRRTLGQYIYSGTETSANVRDQVVSRYCMRHNLPPKFLMVDQLWLWVIKNDLVVSCFPERWEQPKKDPLNTLDRIIQGLYGEQNISSAHELAMFIFSHCCNIFDRPRVGQDYQFLNMYQNSIGHLIKIQNQSLRELDRVFQMSAQWLEGRKLRQRHTVQLQSSLCVHDEVLDALLEQGTESSMLREISDIREELNIIAVILGSQSSILETFGTLTTEELCETGEKGPATDNLVGHLGRLWQEQKRKIEPRRRVVERIDKRAENVYLSLRSALEVKQMQSNALEAKFARDQAVEASKQGQTILVFTIVTIVFLPMSFVATIFTINLDLWGSSMSFSFVAKYIFGIGFGIAVPLIALALAFTDINATLKHFLVSIKNLLLWGRAPPKRDVLGHGYGEELVPA